MLALCDTPAHAVVRGTEPAPSDRRFDAVCAVTLTRFMEDDNYFGSGVLIAPNVVLTAKHLTIGTSPSDNWIVSFRRKPDDSVGNIFPLGHESLFHVPVTHIAPCPAGGADMMLLFLAFDVPHIAPMRYDLDEVKAPPGTTLYFAGWGSESERYIPAEIQVPGGLPRRLKYGTFTRTAYPYGRSLMGAKGYGDSTISDSYAPCTSCGPTVNKFDSGGPLMRLEADNTFTVIGITVSVTDPTKLPQDRVFLDAASAADNHAKYAIFQMLSSLSNQNDADKAFLISTWATIEDPVRSLALQGTPPGKLRIIPSLQTTASATGYPILELARRVSGVTDFYSRNPISEQLNNHVVVSALHNFSFAQTHAVQVDLDEPTIVIGDCIGGAVDSKLVMQSRVTGTGNQDSIELSIEHSLSHSASFANVDNNFRSFARLNSIDAQGPSQVPIAVASTSFVWEHSRASGQLRIHAVGPLSQRMQVQLEVDLNKDGVVDASYSEVLLPTEAADGSTGFDRMLSAFAGETNAVYRVTLFVLPFSNAVHFSSPGCQDSKLLSHDMTAVSRIRIYASEITQ